MIYDWMREASRVFFNTMAERGPFEYMTDEEQEGVESELMRIIAAAFAEHDVERVLREVGCVFALSPPSELHDFWKFCPFGLPSGEGATIPAAVAAAREAMGK